MNDPSGFGALAQMLPALALIVGALLFVKRWAARGGSRIRPTEGVKVLSRTGLTRGAVLAVVEVGQKRYLVGAGEQGVRMLTEIEGDWAPEVTGPMPALQSGHRPIVGGALQMSAATDSRLAGTRPWMGLVDRLKAMTVRSYPARPTDVSPR